MTLANYSIRTLSSTSTWPRSRAVFEEDEDINDESDIIDILREIIKPVKPLYFSTHFEQFYVCKVVEMCIAVEEVEDDNGHQTR